MQIIFSDSINGFIKSHFENKVLLKPVLEGTPVLHISILVMNRLNTTESVIFIYWLYTLLPTDLPYQTLFISTAAGVVPCGGRITSPRTSS